MFGTAIDYAKVRIRRRKWFPFQPVRVAMAPLGHIHFHPSAPGYCEDFSQQALTTQAFFMHEMTHVWQHQKGIFLPLRRHLLCRYDYSLKPGQRLERYGIEQQAEIISHAFQLRNGAKLAGVADKTAYDVLVNFPGASKG